MSSSSGSSFYNDSHSIGLLQLPDLVLDKIFGYLSYATVSQMRLLSRCANQLCEYRLNRGFYKMERSLQDSQRFVKSKLPRRESERKLHPFSRHSEILSAVDTRVSLLGMTYVKHMQFGRCCFIPVESWTNYFAFCAQFEAVVTKKEHLYKILVIGDLGTGKTSIVKRYVHNFFSQNYKATIGVDFALKVLDWDERTKVRLQLWDIAGQERFGQMTRVYYKEAVGAFVVFDLTRNSSFEAVPKWKSDLDNKLVLADGSNIPCVLLANKCDCVKDGLVQSSRSQMDEFARDKGFLAWFETSAKDNIGIEDAANSLVRKILENSEKMLNDREDELRGMRLDDGQGGGDAARNGQSGDASGANGGSGKRSCC